MRGYIDCQDGWMSKNKIGLRSIYMHESDADREGET